MTAYRKHLVRFAVLAMMGLCAKGYGDYQLVWSDEFEGSSLNTLDWSYDIGNGCPSLCGWGNNELQYYRSQNVSVSGGNLVIEIREDDAGYDYTSGKIHTRDKQDFLYGKIEARMKVPTGGGMWPAFWMMPTDSVYGGWAASGEIDIMETKNDTTYVGGTIHYGGGWPNNQYSGGSYSPGGVDFSDDFHVYTLEWMPDMMKWYVDGIHYLTKISDQWYSDGAPSNPRAPFDQEFYILINAAVGGNYTGCTSSSCVTADFPQQYLVDWVRVYQDTSNVAPSVSITSPADGADLPAGDILIEADASDTDGTVETVEFYEGANFLGQDTTEPYSLNWVSVTDGCYTITAKAIDDVGGSGTDTISINVGLGCGQTPFGGSPIAIPGRIQAENFDNGGMDVAYYDTDAGNNGNQYRTLEDVDIEGCSDTGGGYNIGWVRLGEWMEYTISVPAAGTYTIEARVASSSTGGTFRLEFDGVDKTGTITVPVTGGWQSWTTVSDTAALSAGTQVMRFVSTARDFNINYFNITATMVTVPDVVGMDQVSAQSALTAAGLSVGAISQSFSYTVQAGDTVSQNTAAGTSAPSGSPVDLVISLGIRGDLDIDGTINSDDLDIMAQEWLTGGVLADIEPIGGDDTVNLMDLAVLASDWGRSI
jgi:beta-glucanase (GH16 family)